MLSHPGLDPVESVWAAWRQLHPTARKAPTKGQRRAIKARLADHSAEDLAEYFRWISEAPHQRSTFCRAQGHDGFASVMRPANCDERMPWVAEWLGDGRPVGDFVEPPKRGEPVPYRSDPSKYQTVEELLALDRQEETT